MVTFSSADVMDMHCFCGRFAPCLFSGLSLAQNLARSLGRLFLSPKPGRRVGGREGNCFGKECWGVFMCVMMSQGHGELGAFLPASLWG